MKDRETFFWICGLFAVVICLAVFIYGSNIEASWIPLNRISRIPYFDKIGHFFVMGFISFFAIAAFGRHLPFPPRKSSLILMFVVLLISTLEEISQAFFPSRTCSFADLAFSFAGIFLFGLMGHGFSLWQRKLRSASAAKESIDDSPE